MTDQELEALLAEVARSRDDLTDPRWEALARGDLSDAERRALRSTAGGDELAGLLEPLGAAFVDRATDRIVALREGAAAAPEIAPLRRRVPRVVWPILALAALALVFLRSAPLPELPTYTIEVHGQDRALRGRVGGDEIVHVSPGTRLEVVVRPATDVTAPLEVTARVLRSDGQVVPFGGGIELAPSGAVRLIGTLGDDLDLPPGTSRIAVAVHPPGRAPDVDAVLTGAADAPPGVLTVAVVVLP